MFLKRPWREKQNTLNKFVGIKVAHLALVVGPCEEMSLALLSQPSMLGCLEGFSRFLQSMCFVFYLWLSCPESGAKCFRHHLQCITLMMSNSNALFCLFLSYLFHLQATHYSFLATLEVLGKLSFSALAGAMVDTVGFPIAFILFLFLTSSSALHVWRATETGILKEQVKGQPQWPALANQMAWVSERVWRCWIVCMV